VSDIDELKARVAELEVERDRFRAHSVILNRVAWRIAETLGDVKDGDTSHYGDVLHDLDRLIAVVTVEDK
jgi:hypothetical protein